MGNRVAVFEKLTKENLKKAIQEKCNVIIYNDFELEEAPDNFQLINHFPKPPRLVSRGFFCVLVQIILKLLVLLRVELFGCLGYCSQW